MQPSRSRAATADDLPFIPWLVTLDAAERARALADLRVVAVDAGELLCRVGRPVTYWFGVIDGLLKMSNDSVGYGDDGMDDVDDRADDGRADGRKGSTGRQGRRGDTTSVTFAGLPPGGWFGEGTVLKRESYRYNIQALRRSVVAGITVDTFHWLLDRSIGFNRFITLQLNERLGQFIAAREIDRLTNPDERVARSLAALFHPQLYPGVGQLLRITQQELAYLVGLSRQRVNEALASLQAGGEIRVEYGGVRVIDLDRLRGYRSRRT